MQLTKTINQTVTASQAGQVVWVPFEIPADVTGLSFQLSYPRSTSEKQDTSTGWFQRNYPVANLDLCLLDPEGQMVGSSGANKKEIIVSEAYATPGYRRRKITPGVWQLLIGVQAIAVESIEVLIELTFRMKERHLYLGDLHTHTINSDGEFSYLDLAKRAKALGLDFLAFTDHNYLADLAELPNLEDLTLIPGVEWSHYLGHANFYGIDGRLEEPIFVNGFQGPESLFASIQEKGAVVTVNHPFKEYFPFQFDLTGLSFDCIEVWNGPMGAANKQAIDLWHRLLASGKHVTACGGSDYHNDLSTRMMGRPTTGVYADSANPADILEALRRGHCFVKASPQGPNIQVHTFDGIMGDSVPWRKGVQLSIDIERLAADDQVWMVSYDQRALLCTSSGRGDFHGDVSIEKPGFSRIEVMRENPESQQTEPILIANPIYFE